MKAKSLFVFTLLCLLIAAGGVTILTRNQAQASAKLSDLASLNYKLIEGVYYHNGSYLSAKTWYKIYNTSLSDNITLGSVYVMQEQGLDSTYTVWDYPDAQVILPPLGSYSFGIEEIGVVPRDPSTPRGSWLLAITWQGAPQDLKVVGHGNSMDSSGDVVAIRTIYPF